MRGSLESGNPEDIRNKVSDLQKACMKIGEAMAKDGQQPQSNQGTGTEGSTEGSEEKKEDKKE